MPEDYVAFGRFHPEKTELSVDRAIMICQDHGGIGHPGGNDLRLRLFPFDVDVVSDHGTDAKIPIFVQDDDAPPDGTPDPSILWAGGLISAGIFSLAGNVSGVSCQMGFMMDTQGAYYNDNNSFVFVDWVDHDPVDAEYWMRVIDYTVGTSKLVINDGDNVRASGDIFQMRGSTINSLFGPIISVNTFDDIAPIVRTAICTIEISKDDGNGLPDGNWAIRTVNLEARFNLEAEPPPPDPDPPDPPDTVDVTGAYTWLEHFGNAFGSASSSSTVVIAFDGVSIWFTIDPNETRPIKLDFTSIEVVGLDNQTRTGSVNQTVGDYTSAPTHTWGLGGGINCGINQIGVYDIDLIPGETYIFSVRNNEPSDPNWMRIQARYRDET